MINKKEEGITLIALVIIILLLIIGVTVISAAIKNNEKQNSVETTIVQTDSEKTENNSSDVTEVANDKVNLIDESNKETITFSIDGIDYEIESGSTWIDFSNNIEQLYYDDSDEGCIGFIGTWLGGGASPQTLKVIYLNDVPVKDSDLIFDGSLYELLEDHYTMYTNDACWIRKLNLYLY